MKDFKDEIQDELDRIISEQRELAKKETDKLLSNSSKEFKEHFQDKDDFINEIGVSKKSNFFKKLFLLVLSFLIIIVLVFAYYELDYFDKFKSKKEPIILKEKMNVESNKKLDSLKNSLHRIVENKDCYSKILNAELTGQKIELPCGSSSGVKGAGKRTDVLLEMINNLNNQIDSLNVKIHIEEKRNDMK